MKENETVQTFLASRLGSWGAPILTGIAFVILGILALGSPFLTTFTITLAVGGLILAAGLVQLVHAIRNTRAPGSSSRYLHSVIALVAGGVILRSPTVGLVGISIALMFYFLVNAAARWRLASDSEGIRGRGWIYASSLASFLLGVYMILDFPVSALWMPGVFLGVDLVIFGMSMVVGAFAIRSAVKEIKKDEEEFRGAA